MYKNASYPKVGNGTGPYSREHTWPKSYGFPDNSGDDDNYPYSDCHMLFLCDKSYNSSRSNRPYRECHPACVEKPTEKNNGQGGGSGEYPGNSNWRTLHGPSGRWETWIGRRGDVARAMFYMDVRYEGGGEPDLILTDNANLIVVTDGPIAYMGILSVLLEWHEQDPVDDVERNRNDVVFSFQENRNPFIDHPEWVACLFLNECDAECPQDFDGDGDVDASDLAIVLGSWGPCEGCPTDFNGDDIVNAADLAQVLGAWGLCP